MAAELELCLETVHQAGLVELIEVAAAAGFDAITANPGLRQEAGLTDAALRARLRDAGVRVTNIDGFGSALPGIPAGEALAPYRSVMGRDFTPCFTRPEEDYYRAAEALGAESVNLVHFAGDPATPFATIVDIVGGVCERAARRGLRIVVEFLPGTGIGGIEAAAAIVAQVGAPNLAIMLDTRHLSRTGGTTADVARHAAQIGGVQLNDLKWADIDDPERLLPGEGELPLKAMVGHIRRARPQTPIGIEVFSRQLLAMPAAEAALVAAASLRSVLDGVAD